MSGQLNLLLHILQFMGQSESAQIQDDNCFRRCVGSPNYHNSRSAQHKKVEAIRSPPPKFNSPSHRFDNQPVYTNQASQKVVHRPISNKIINSNKSINQDPPFDIVTNKFIVTESSSTNFIRNDQVEPLVGESPGANPDIVLGLQSKFSSTKRISYNQITKNTTTKVSTTIQSITGVNERESAFTNDQNQQLQKASRASISRNMLLNKIEQIKQKYYERQLQIEIYEDQYQYIDQIQQITCIQKKYSINKNCLPPQSIHEISEIKAKLIQKLNKRKLEFLDKMKKKNKAQMEVQIDVHDSVTNQLEIYSKQNISIEENILEISAQDKTNKLTKSNKLNRSIKRQLNRQLNNSQRQQSFQGRVQFSQYSQETLHEIRQLDEQDEEYKSKFQNIKSLKQDQINKSIKNTTKNDTNEKSIEKNEVNNQKQSKLIKKNISTDKASKLIFTQNRQNLKISSSKYLGDNRFLIETSTPFSNAAQTLKTHKMILF